MNRPTDFLPAETLRDRQLRRRSGAGDRARDRCVGTGPTLNAVLAIAPTLFPGSAHVVPARALTGPNAAEPRSTTASATTSSVPVSALTTGARPGARPCSGPARGTSRSVGSSSSSPNAPAGTIVIRPSPSPRIDDRQFDESATPRRALACLERWKPVTCLARGAAGSIPGAPRAGLPRGAGRGGHVRRGKGSGGRKQRGRGSPPWRSEAARFAPHLAKKTRQSLAGA